jgi:hypothetical protein
MTEAEAPALLDRMFPSGPVGEDVVSELRSDGWASPGDPLELAHRIGTAIWDVFSENHDVIAPDGRVANLGSWRGSADLIAEFLNARVEGASFGYLDFYMGTLQTRNLQEWGALHRLMFRRLRSLGATWRYAFPRMFLVDLRPLAESNDRPDFESYDPAARVGEQLADAARERKRDELARDIERLNRESVERSRFQEPPSVVASYRAIFGEDPDGWPPV